MTARNLTVQPLSRNERIGLLAIIRGARSLLLRDSEGFFDAVCALEHVGQVLCGEVRNGLNRYKPEITVLAACSPFQQLSRIEAVFDTVRKARNDAVHGGAYIRHHSLRLIELFLILEEAIMAESTQVQDVMVRNPICVELWENIASARRKMLSESFSFLPVRDEAGRWGLLSDLAVIKYLSNSTSERKQRLGTSIEEALKNGLVLEKCTEYVPMKLLAQVIPQMNSMPALVVDNDQLIGIITPFDLL